MLKRTTMSWCWAFAIMANFLGCDSLALKPSKPPLERMEDAIRLGRWDEAWQYYPEVVRSHGDDRKVLSKLAKVAFENQHPNESADLLMAACRAEAFENETRVEQAVVAAIFVGRLFDALQFLESAIQAQPDRAKTRRLAFDLWMGLENRLNALPHGQFLIQKRRFDVELVTSLCNTGRNPGEADSSEKMVQRNEADKRPLVIKAMLALDKNNVDDAFAVLKQILDGHPDDVPAQLLFAEALIANGQFDDLRSWHAKLNGNYQREPAYWKLMGDWAVHRNDPAGASRAYWEATQRDSYLLEAWKGLREQLSQITLSDASQSDDLLSALDRRIMHLQKLKLAKLRFVRTRSISRASAVEIASTLTQLGRLWEAEAWLTIALSFPEDPNTQVPAAREAVISKMNQGTPWEVRDEQPELQIDLSYLPLPKIELNAN